jgi:hypothetical protein
MTLVVKLDPEGQPHWLSKQPRLLRSIIRKVVRARQLRFALRDRPRHLRIVK